jgi:hypothetical protein
MSSQLVITNKNLHYSYTLLLNGKPSGEIPHSETMTIDVEPGKYEVCFIESEASDLPSACKAILVTIKDGRTLPLQVLTKNFTIHVYDRAGTHLNPKTGFLCERIGTGIYIENPLTDE